MYNKTLVVVAGPTASGKTALAVQLAQHYQTEIISADSRQFYREISIGTAKPSAEELAAVPHHFINSHHITDNLNVADFERQGLIEINRLFKNHDVVVMAGGSGLYIKAITEGFDDLPAVDPAIRRELNQLYATQGIGILQQQLQGADPVYYAQADIRNPQRLIRALEVTQGTGRPYSSFRKSAFKQRPFNIIKLAFDLPREVLYSRINTRVEQMMAAGLLNEVRQMLPYRQLNALNTVGYTELFSHLDGKTTLPEATASIQQNTRRFAKRQLTWFRKDADIHWVNGDIPEIIKLIDDYRKA